MSEWPGCNGLKGDTVDEACASSPSAISEDEGAEKLLRL